ARGRRRAAGAGHRPGRVPAGGQRQGPVRGAGLRHRDRVPARRRWWRGLAGAAPGRPGPARPAPVTQRPGASHEPVLRHDDSADRPGPAAAGHDRRQGAVMGAGPGYSLQGMLPAEVLVGGTAVWSRYRQYPVFSRGWLVRRSLLFCSVIAVVVAVIGLGTGVALQSSRLGLEVAAVQFLAFGLMATLGPALGTWVRHRRWRESHERWGVVIAVLLGMVLSYSVDRVASAHVEELVRPRLGLLGSTPPP